MPRRTLAVPRRNSALSSRANRALPECLARGAVPVRAGRMADRIAGRITRIRAAAVAAATDPALEIGVRARPAAGLPKAACKGKANRVLGVETAAAKC